MYISQSVIFGSNLCSLWQSHSAWEKFSFLFRTYWQPHINVSHIHINIHSNENRPNQCVLSQIGAFPTKAALISKIWVNPSEKSGQRPILLNSDLFPVLDPSGRLPSLGNAFESREGGKAFTWMHKLSSRIHLLLYLHIKAFHMTTHLGFKDTFNVKQVAQSFSNWFPWF